MIDDSQNFHVDISIQDGDIMITFDYWTLDDKLKKELVTLLKRMIKKIKEA